MVALNYKPICGCGNPLKIFKSSGRAAKTCSQACARKEYPSYKSGSASARHPCIDCGKPVCVTSLRCHACYGMRVAVLNSSCICVGCGKTYVNKRHGTKGEGSKYCSRECSAAHMAAAPFSAVRFNTCKQCGKEWTARCAASLCSKNCRLEYLRAEALDRYRLEHAAEVAARESVPCIECGKKFVPTHGRVACSDRCAMRIQRHRGSNNYRRKARSYGVEYEPVNRRKVFERDGWRCQICGRPTPSARQGTTHSNAPELDHRIPISKGGPHTYSNVQCACRKCNGEKGNRCVIGQLPLYNH